VIGREKDPSNSEVRRLIQDSIEQDRRRAEAAKAREMLHRLQNQQDQEERVSDEEEHLRERRDSVVVCCQNVVVINVKFLHLCSCNAVQTVECSVINIAE